MREKMSLNCGMANSLKMESYHQITANWLGWQNERGLTDWCP